MGVKLTYHLFIVVPQIDIIGATGNPKKFFLDFIGSTPVFIKYDNQRNNNEALNFLS
jgi:hypothetical protein